MVLDQLASVTVHDRLGLARGARGEQRVQRVVERDRIELERRRLGEQLHPTRRLGNARLAVWDPNEPLDRRQRLPDQRQLAPAVDVAVAIAVAADAEHDPWLELREPVDDAARAKLGRADGPHRAEAGGGGERDDRLGNVRQVRDHPVTRAGRRDASDRRGHAPPGRAALRTSARPAVESVNALAPRSGHGPPRSPRDARRS